MSEHLYTHRKTSDRSASISQHSPFQPRPFVVQTQTEEQSEQPDIKTALQRAEGYGHRLDHIKFSENHAPAQVRRIVQAKLTIGEPGDKYEQEADRVAASVVNSINVPSSEQTEPTQAVQRQEEEEEEIQAKPEITALQRQKEPVEEIQAKLGISEIERSPLPTQAQREAMPEEEELQTKPTLQGREAIGGGEASTDLESAINSAKEGGKPLEASLQRSMGQAMGADLSGVKVHTDAQADKLNQSIQAKAFTTGQNVFFRSGEYNPGSRGGQELIAHELTHVVQQSGGAVQRSACLEERIQETTPIEVISGKRTIQRGSEFSKEASRISRITARTLTNKKLPANTYRWDTRTPEVIANEGFQPRNPTGNIQLDEHVNNVIASGAQQGQVAKMESQWVSTGAYGMLKMLDPTFAQQVFNTNLYKIDTSRANKTGKFRDVNHHFDKIKQDRPYPSQREWAKLGGIPPEAVVAWMPGNAFVNQYNIQTGAPTENELTGWLPMPTNV